MKAQQGGLPYDAEIEYLESSGTQYIDTGIIPDDTYGMSIDLYKLTNADSYCCGLRDTTGDTRYCIGTITISAYGGWGGILNSLTMDVNTRAVVELNFLNSRYLQVNGQGSITFNTLPFTPTNEIRIFGSSGVSASYTKYTGRVYGFKISKGSDIIMDMIPVRVGSVGYMYDRVSGQLFGNQGTGNFVLGPDKN